MFRAWLTAAVLVLAVMGPADAAEGESGFAIGPHVSTLGLGVEGSAKLSDNLVLRLGGSYFAIGVGEGIDGISYNVDLTLASAGGALDLHPFGNGFLVSAGVFWNGNGADFDATPTSSVTIGNSTYTPTQVGRLDGEIEFNPVAPYVGIGWDASHFGDGALSFRFRAGLFYMGKPDVTLRSTGTLASNAAFQADLAREETNMEDELEILGFYPAATIGFTYRF